MTEGAVTGSGRMCQHNETAMLIVSDAHDGKETSSFDPNILGRRLSDMVDRVSRLRSHQADCCFDKLIVVFAGDMIDGGEVYPTQAHHQAFTSRREQIQHSCAIWADALLKLQCDWQEVEVQAVPGNHGRTSRFAHESDNGDLLLYDALRQKLNGKVTLHYDDGDDPFVRKFRVRGHEYLITHGADIKAWQGIPFYGIQQRLLKWHSSFKLGGFDVAFMGHFHNSTSIRLTGALRYFITGTAVSDDDWALRLFGGESATNWWFIGVSDKRPITFQYEVDLLA